MYPVVSQSSGVDRGQRASRGVVKKAMTAGREGEKKEGSAI